MAQGTATEPRVDFATYLSGGKQTTISASALDRNGNLYVTGTTSSGDYPTTPGAFLRTPRQVCVNGSCGFSATFITKLSRDGSSLVYSTFLSKEGVPSDIAVDDRGNVYVTGPIVDPDYEGTPGTWRTKCQSPNPGAPAQFCAWLVKLNASGSSVIYSTLIDDIHQCFSDQHIAVNAAGEVYVAGTGSVGRQCFTTPNAYRKTVTGGESGTIVMKFNANASNVLFSTWVSSAAPRDEFRALAVAPNDHAVVVGNTRSGNFPTTRGAFQRAKIGSGDVYIAKLSSDGRALLASTVLGGGMTNESAGVAVDSALNVYVTGVTGSPDFPTTPGAYRRILDQQNCSGAPSGFQQCTDLFVTKLPPDFSGLIFSTLLGGNGDESPPHMAIDGVGHVYLTGGPRPNHPLVKPVQSEFRPIYVTKLNTSGSGLLFSTFFGGTIGFSGFQTPAGIQADTAGDAYIAWYTTSTDFPTTDNAYQTFNHSDEQAPILAKFDIPPCSLAKTIPSVTICTPAGGTTAGSPVLISAGASDDRPIAGMVVYVDGVKKFTISKVSHFDTRVALVWGMHQLTVKAWDSDGRVFSNARMIIVH